MPYLINGSAASLSPQRQIWQDIILGRDHNGLVIYGSNKNIQLDFDNCTYTLYNQWAQLVNGTSLVTITVLAQDEASYVAFSGINLEFNGNKPNQEAGIVGPWSLLVTNVTPA